MTFISKKSGLIVADECVYQSEISTDGTMSANSDNLIPTQKAVVSYVSAHSGSSNPFADNTSLVKNNSDNTKLLILSAASISTGTTRTLTAPDISTTLVGRSGNNIANQMTFWNDANQVTSDSSFIYNPSPASQQPNFQIGPSSQYAGTSIYAGSSIRRDTTDGSFIASFENQGSSATTISRIALIGETASSPATNARYMQLAITSKIYAPTGGSTLQPNTAYVACGGDLIGGMIIYHDDGPLQITGQIRDATTPDFYMSPWGLNGVTQANPGFIGLGTNAPTYDLHVLKNTVGGSVMAAVRNTSATGFTYVRTLNDVQNNFDLQNFGTSYAGGTGGCSKNDRGVLQGFGSNGVAICSANAAGGILFYAGGTAAANLAVNISPAGKMAIGLTSTIATYTLDVGGDIGIATANKTLRLPSTRLGQATLVAGTVSVSLTGLTTSSRVFIQQVLSGGTTGTQYKAVCTSGTLTISAISTIGVTVTTDTSTLNYVIFENY